MDSSSTGDARRYGSPAFRFIKPYYLANAAMLASYALVRIWFYEHSNLEHSRLSGARQLLAKESQGFTLLAVSLSLKFLRRQSLDAFLADAFFFSKGLIALMAFYMDWRVLTYYVIMYMLVFSMYPQPTYQGPSRMEYFTPASFSEMVEERTDTRTAWLVTFFAPWAPQCLYLEPVIAELSLKYTTQNLRFGKVDISRWPRLGSQYKVSPSATTNQLPTLIMFEGGKETGRIPHVYEDGSVARGKFRKGDIVTAFALEERLAGRHGAGGEGSKAGTSGGGGKGRVNAKKRR